MVGEFTKQGLPAGAATVGVVPPTGYTAPMPPNELESRDLAHCEPELVRRYLLLKADFEHQTGRCLFETTTWRSSERQASLYAQGRTAPGKKVTNIDGVNSRSRHNYYPSQAIDVCVDGDPGPGKVAIWDTAAYEPLGPLCAKHGLVWGGNFKSIHDYPHLEMEA
jgi:peptidoglycan L-alanyl-D-glutamate endopeptidase CwlK